MKRERESKIANNRAGKQTDTLWGSIALEEEKEEEEGAAVKQWAESWLDKQQQRLLKVATTWTV